MSSAIEVTEKGMLIAIIYGHWLHTVRVTRVLFDTLILRVRFYCFMAYFLNEISFNFKYI
jgi:hypothetical protein